MEAICEQCGHRFCFELSEGECAKCGSLHFLMREDEAEYRPTDRLSDEIILKNTVVKILQHIQFLEDLPPKYIDQIAEISRVRDLVHGEVVFNQGENANAMYLIVSGAVSLRICDGGQSSKQIVTLRMGDLLGWSSLTNKPLYAATAVVDGPTRLIEIDGARIQALCREDSKFGYEILRRTIQTLSKRLILAWSQLTETYLPHIAQAAIVAAAQRG
jgi:CRP/FNR family cyclic AMP-dependent transcriptional regulator